MSVETREMKEIEAAVEGILFASCLLYTSDAADD